MRRESSSEPKSSKLVWYFSSDVIKKWKSLMLYLSFFQCYLNPVKMKVLLYVYGTDPGERQLCLTSPHVQQWSTVGEQILVLRPFLPLIFKCLSRIVHWRNSRNERHSKLAIIRYHRYYISGLFSTSTF